MAAAKSGRNFGAAGRHKAARPMQNRGAGKHAPESRPSKDETLPDWKSDQAGGMSHDRASEPSSPRGSRWESTDDQDLVPRSDRPGEGPLDDDAPEESER